MSERLLVVAYDRSLEGNAAARDWAMDRLREALPLGERATVILATVTPRLGQAMRAHLTDRSFRFVEFFDDGVRRDWATRRTSMWLADDAPDELDHCRRAVFHAVLTAVDKARVAGLEPALLVLRDARSAALYGELAAGEWIERGWSAPAVHTFGAD